MILGSLKTFKSKKLRLNEIWIEWLYYIKKDNRPEIRFGLCIRDIEPSFEQASQKSKINNSPNSKFLQGTYN